MKLSKDVEIDEQVDFNTLLQNEQLLQGLSLSGYERPSPIQLKAIPIGRLGIDLIAQAKSGTGKTVVFGVIAIENVNSSIQLPQVIMVAPTREIAVQIRDVVRSLAQLMPLKCEAIIGGLSVQADAQKLAGCQIIVGTPGRLLALLEDKKINTSQLKLWVMDEADKLMSDKLQSQVQAVFNRLPKTIQCIAFSATFTEELVADLSMFMKSPQQIRLTEGVPTLKEVQQYYVNIQEASSNLAAYRLKFEEAAKLLSKIPFYQCMIFVNNLPRSIELTDWLNEIGWKSGHISSSLTQDKRLLVMEQMRQFKLRVLVCSDLVARGIDIDRVNLVINLDMPWEVETYLHRVGRTGRYGTSGIAVNLIGTEDVTFLNVLKERKIQVRPLPVTDKVSYSEYIKELSAEEQDSLKKHQSVNIEAKPFRHVEKIKKKQQPLKKKNKKLSEIEATKINVRIKKTQPKPMFIPPDLFF